MLREDRRVVATVRWSDMTEALAFKRDLLTTDIICVACRIGADSESDRAVIVHEEMPGFVEWMNALPARLPGVQADWYVAVMLPACETSPRVIWRRDVVKQDSQS